MTAAVAVPVHKAQPSDDEWLSLRQVVHVLDEHPIHLVVPMSLDVAAYTAECPTLIVTRVPERFFGSSAAHSRMLMSSEFYELFAQYSHVLVHHLDAYVFRDELDRWCSAGFDYVGPPWFEGYDKAADDAPLVGVGNGGFSLRKVSSFLHVTRLLERKAGRGVVRRLPDKVRLALRRTVLPLARGLRVPRRVYESMVGAICGGFPGNEDLFWGRRVHVDLPWFTVIEPHDAARFAFENQPSRLFELTEHRLPFGCHGWPRYEPEFWRPLIEAGDALPEVAPPDDDQTQPTAMMPVTSDWATVDVDGGSDVEPAMPAMPAVGVSGRRAATGTIATATALVFSQATVAIALLLVARRTETDQFGEYIGMYTLSLSIAALLDFGSSQLRTRELARDRQRRHFRWWLARRTKLQSPVVALFGVAAVVVIGDQLPLWCTIGLAAQTLTYNISQGSNAAVRGTRSPVIAEWYTGIGNTVLLVVAVAAPDRLLLAAAGLAAAFSWVVTASLGLWSTRHHVGGAPSYLERNPWAGSASFGISSLSTSIHGFLLGVVIWTRGPDEAARIGAVNKWAQPITLFASAYASYMFPSFAAAPTHRAAIRSMRPLVVIGAAGTAFAAVLFVVSPILTETLLGEQYAHSTAVLRMLLIAAVPVLVAQPLSALLQARGDDRYVARVFVSISVITFIGAAVTSIEWGAMSIPIFSFVGSSLMVVLFGRRTAALWHHRRSLDRLDVLAVERPWPRGEGGSPM